MWLSLAFVSALFLGLYDVAKKRAVADNAVAVVLLLNTALSTLLFSPVIIASLTGAEWFSGTMFDYGTQPLDAHLKVMLKACITLSSWGFGYVGIKHLPITIVGPINATRPVIVLLGALLIFGERLNALQWVGVSLAFVSILLLRDGRRVSTSCVTAISSTLPLPPCWVLRVVCMTATCCVRLTLCLCRAGSLCIRP